MLMATIEKRNGKYRVKVRLKGVTKSETFTLKSDAVAWTAFRVMRLKVYILPIC